MPALSLALANSIRFSSNVNRNEYEHKLLIIENEKKKNKKFTNIFKRKSI